MTDPQKLEKTQQKTVKTCIGLEIVMNKSMTFTLFNIGCWLSFGITGCSSLQPQETSGSSPVPTTSAASTTTSTTKPSAPNSTTTSQNGSTAKPTQSPTAPASGNVPSPSLDPKITASRPPLTVEKLKNADYYFLAKGPIKLTNGTYEDKDAKRTYTMSDVVAYGDINKDGIKDAVSVLKVTIPNMGDFSYLVAFVNEGGNPKNVSTEFMGPQIKVKSLKINADNSIEAVMDQYEAGSPDPSLAITRTYKLRSNQAQAPATPKK
ncbi:MAG: hypothetical protein IGS48_22325 [Oscillatoriales cyanobacterium C42_A2020_001]|nr:hypothetical protein [Leptolyngbyaceae cyanobacterium C42_A2020_001]